MRILKCGIFIVTAFTLPKAGYQAIVRVPVANVIPEPFKIPHISAQNIKNYYETIPLSGNSGNDTICQRNHQLLLHEEVTIVDQRGHQACIIIPNITCINPGNQTKQLFWTFKDYLIKKDLLSHQEKLPLPITTYNQKNMQDIAVLIKPWHEHKSNIALSAGTRFVVATDYTNSNDPYVPVYILHHRTVRTIALPRSHCLLYKKNNTLSFEHKKKLFVHILKTWAGDIKNGRIPYVWGGCSFIENVSEETFQHMKFDALETKKFVCSFKKSPIASGLDCSGLILRAAQIAQLPYLFKNSTTIKASLKPLTENDQVKDGDIIWFQGHVMIISDVKNNLIIEARHYNADYGYVHEKPVHMLFNNIQTVQDLLKTIAQKKPLFLLHRNGSVIKKIAYAQILSLDSLVEKKASNFY